MRISFVSVVVALVAIVGSSTTAHGQTFTDDPLTPGTAIKAVHITELRDAVANLRTAVGLPVFMFTDAVTPGITQVRALHIYELRTALNDVFDAAPRPRPTYTDPTLEGVGIKAVHIQELRYAVATIVPIVGVCQSGSGTLINGAMHCGTISAAGQTDVWTFSATAGDRIAVHIGKTKDVNGFVPWIRVVAPNSTVLSSSYGANAAAIDTAANLTGTYQVLVASLDSGLDGLGSYRLTMTHSPGPISVTAGDEGGPLTNGAMHTGRILQGDLDVWTFTATAGDRIAVHIGEISDTDGAFTPWIRVWGPTGAVLGSSYGGLAAAIDTVAGVTGTYLVLVASLDAGYDGEGTYRLTMTHTPGPITVTAGDQGGPLDNGAMHTGEIIQGDLDVWTFDATAGERIAVHIGEITDTDGAFTPWIRVWGPTGAVLGSSYGGLAAVIETVAGVTGTYLVLVASLDAGYDGEGTYRLTMTHTPGPITVSPGDQGGSLDNGAVHTGEIVQGDVDVWTFTATAGDRIAVHIGEISDTDGAFTPWIRVWGPTGAVAGSSYGGLAAAIDTVAGVSGTYLVLVASLDAGYDGEGTYRLTMTHTPGPITVSPGDQGGSLDNGAMHTGEIVQGDVDVWTFDATAGDRIAVHIGEISDTDGAFTPWIRVWGPTGAVAGSSYGGLAAAIDTVAGVSGTYLVLVASLDAGYDGEGTYRLTMTHTPGPVVVSPGDEGGSTTSGALNAGTILMGDLDTWMITVPQNYRVTVTISETSDTSGTFTPWIRLWAPNGTVAGSTYGASSAAINNAVAPVAGTYLVLVASLDAGYDGTGTYQMTVTLTPPP